MRRDHWQVVIRETANTGNVATRRALHITKAGARLDLCDTMLTYQRLGMHVTHDAAFTFGVAVDNQQTADWFNRHGEVLGFSTYVVTVEKYA